MKACTILILRWILGICGALTMVTAAAEGHVFQSAVGAINLLVATVAFVEREP